MPRDGVLIVYSSYNKDLAILVNNEALTWLIKL